MKRFFTTILIGFCGLVQFRAAAAPALDYLNHGQVTSPINIDAIVFENFDTFSFTNSAINTNFGTPGASELTQIFIPFDTLDTVNFSNYNSGLIHIAPGFRFDTGTGGVRRSAQNFYNAGTIIGQDLPATLFSLNSGVTARPSPQPSQVLVFATNIVNDGGDISVGNDGLLQLTGNSINLANSSLAAGSISETDPNNVTGRENFYNQLIFGTLSFVDPVGVYDLAWGFGTGLEVTATRDPGASGTYTVDFVNLFNFFNLFFGVTTRDGGANLGLNFNTFASNSFPGQSVFAYQSPTINVSNALFYNDLEVVFVNTNLPDTNINVSVGFNFANSTNLLLYGFNTSGAEAIVRFSEAVPDVVTGQTTSNSIYVIDTGGLTQFFLIETNAAYLNGFGRPDNFEVTTTEPAEWSGAQPANVPFNPAVIGNFLNFFGDDAFYRVQVGRNPEQLDGNFTSYQTNFVVVSPLDITDPTNEPGRLEIFGNQVNLTKARLRAEGVASITATNITGSPLIEDWGNVNADLSNTNGFLTVSNIFPTTFKRLRGDITMWAGNGIFTNFGGGVTNVYFAHILWVGPSLNGSFRSSTRNLALRATNTTVVQDNIRVIGNSLILASNLTLNSQMDLTQNAGSIFPTNTPRLKHLLLQTNAVINVDNIFDVGFNASTGHSGPAKRKYTVPSITNFGFIKANAPLLQSSNFECDGTIIATNGGSMIIEAANLGLGTALVTQSNLLQADGDITLSANFIGVTNSFITCGGTNGGSKGSLTLETTAGGEITDFASGTPGTNGRAANLWVVSDGFSLPVKPATGDLFGTEIVTMATNYTVATHNWAGADFGATSDGFQNNMVIGHLKLSRQSTGAELHFAGATAGGQYGMYVDYLELDTNSYSYSDYRNGLLIDSNLTVYFAGCNVDPVKLQAVYTNRLVWVPSFYGPNSTVSVPYTNCAGVTQYCLMNVNLATSPVISFFGNLPNAFNQPFVLNDPSGNCTNIATNFTSCGGGFTTFRDYLVKSGTTGTNYVNVEITTVGSGTITPSIKQKQMAMGKKYVLTATPSKGWQFAGWTAVGLPGGTELSSRVLKFSLEKDLMLTAKFVPKTFTLVEGTYYGLFVSSNTMPTPANSGWFTMTVTAGGSCSGHLLMGPDIFSFSGQVPTNGLLVAVAKHGSQTETVNLQLDMTGTTGQVTGYVGGPSIHLLGNLAPNWTPKDPSPYAGQFTMILTNGSSNGVPIGDSYGALAISKTGALSTAGVLADGDAFSQSVPISKDGFWPFYTYVPKGQDFLLGWISFQSNPVNGPSINPGSVFWSKGAMPKAKYYPAGFTNIFNLTGSTYNRPGKGAGVLTLANPVVILSGDGMAKSITEPVAMKNDLLYYGTNLTLSINPAGGTFSGRIQNGAGEPSIRLNGVILQNQDSAFGFFMGTNEESGAVLFQSQ